MRSLSFSLIVVSIFSVVSVAQKGHEHVPVPPLAHFNIDQVDGTLDPCADFFQYACSKWIKANPIPADLAVNFGAIGTAIGHETIHGFDDQGRKFNAHGNLRDWWTPEDAANYDQREKCIQDEYTQDVPEAGIKQNGALSAGEDTADNGGVRIALSALENNLAARGETLDSAGEDGFTELQTFFLAYSEVWCSALRPEAARTAVLTQGHSLDRYRVDNVLSNMPEFEHAFGCHARQPMVHPNQCRVW